MRLGDILKHAGDGSAPPAPTKQVKFRVLGNPNGQPIIADAEAVLSFVDEHERAEAKRDARRELRVLYGDDPVPPDALADETTAHILFRALRDASDPRVRFAQTVLELKHALTIATRDDLQETLSAFLTEEFPPLVDDATFEELKKDAEKNSLAALLSSGVSSTKKDALLRALPSLVGHYARFPTRMSGAGGPA